MSGWALELEDGDAAILARALKAYRPETTEEESVILFFLERFQNMAASDAMSAAPLKKDRRRGMNETDDWREYGDCYVYCPSHLRPHSTGWCTVPASEKTKLDADTYVAALAECKRRGFKVTL